MKRTTAMIALALSLTLTACGGTPAPTDVPAVPTQNTPAAPETASGSTQTTADVVATVNGQPITRGAYERALQRARQYHANPDDPTLPAQILEMLIEQAVINQSAAELNVSVSDAEVQAEIAKLKESLQSAEEWQAWLDVNLFTEAEMIEAAREQILTTRVREAVIAQEAAATGSGTVQHVRARHILVGTQAEADALLERLQAGEDFAALAATYSRDVTTKDSGGDLGFFIRTDLTTPELAEAAFSLQPGAVGGPVQTALGFHVIQTIEFADTPVTAETQGAQFEARFAEWLAQKRATATVERFID